MTREIAVKLDAAELAHAAREHALKTAELDPNGVYNVRVSIHARENVFSATVFFTRVDTP